MATQVHRAVAPDATPAGAELQRPAPEPVADRDGAAARLHAAFSRILGPDWRLELWDGRSAGPAQPGFVLRLCRAEAVGRLLGGLPERAFGRAYVERLVEVDPLEPFLLAMAGQQPWRLLRAWPFVTASLLALGGRPESSPVAAAEARLRGRRHSRRRDADAIKHHYDLPVEFYRLFLGPSMTYSCAYFESPEDDLETAQRAKLDLVCRKLRLRKGERLLDIGSGWGELIMHAAEHYGVHAVGITLSRAQADFAKRRIGERGLEHRVEARLADYRDDNGIYDAVASVGMVEHVGRTRLAAYSDAVRRSLRPGGRALIHGITRPPTGGWSRGSFTDTFVFPDSELLDIGLMLRAYERAGLEVRDVESLREHYELTVRHWSQRLEDHWTEAVSLAGAERARVWRLYMQGGAVAFRLGHMNIDQTLVVRPHPDGRSDAPLTRLDWYRG